jgi:hypothetical protein
VKSQVAGEYDQKPLHFSSGAANRLKRMCLQKYKVKEQKPGQQIPVYRGGIPAITGNADQAEVNR